MKIDLNFQYPTPDQIDSKLKTFCSPKYIKNKYPDFYIFLQNKYNFLKSGIKITEAMWLFYNNLDEPPTCKCCGNRVKFENWRKGYRIYCSQICMSRSTREKAGQTQIEKYGGIGLGADIIKKKIFDSTIEKYGGIGFASEITSKKIKKNMIEKYGVTNPMQSEELKLKIENTNLEKYGVKHALQHPDFLEKSKQTCLKNHGVLYPGQSKEIMDRVVKTQIEKYGGCGYASEEIRNKIIQTNLERYGRMYGFDYEKIASTNLERYGDENPLIARCSRGEIIYQGYSKKSQKCFRDFDNYLCNKYTTQYAEKGGEKLIIVDEHKYYVDFFIKELNVVIEFNGDAWHGNPNIYNENDLCFPMDNITTAKDLWENDRIRNERLESDGIKVIIMWESEYDKCEDIKSWLEDKLNINL